jgi:hypothetical protein
MAFHYIILNEAEKIMPKEKLEPSQWVVDVVALSGAAGEFLSQAGGTITTAIAVISVASVVGICVVSSKDLPPWAQLILGTSGIAGVVYDPKKGRTDIKQEFQQPVDNAMLSVKEGITSMSGSHAVTGMPAESNYSLPQFDNDLDDNGEWLTPEEAATRY